MFRTRKKKNWCDEERIKVKLLSCLEHKICFNKIGTAVIGKHEVCEL